MVKLLGARALKELGIAKSWVMIRELRREPGFPLGRLVGHLRKWTEEEIEDWFRRCRTERPSPIRGAAKQRSEKARCKAIFKPMPPQGIARICADCTRAPVQSEPHGSAAGGDRNPSDEVMR
jgi:hypothetical protein